MQSISNYSFQVRLRERLAQSRTLFRHELEQLRNPEHSAANLATAFALGTLLSFIPVPLLDSMLVAVIVARFKQVNRAPLFMARLLWNDLVVFPFYGTGYRIGAALIAPLTDANSALSSGGTAVRSLLSLTLGTVILAAGLAAAGYVLFMLGITFYRMNQIAACANVKDDVAPVPLLQCSKITLARFAARAVRRSPAGDDLANQR